ncbi:MAG: hypothetical protein OCD01_06790 [Fibrobacterales bacterium]
MYSNHRKCLLALIVFSVSLLSIGCSEPIAPLEFDATATGESTPTLDAIEILRDSIILLENQKQDNITGTDIALLEGKIQSTKEEYSRQSEALKKNLEDELEKKTTEVATLKASGATEEEISTAQKALDKASALLAETTTTLNTMNLEIASGSTTPQIVQTVTIDSLILYVDSILSYQALLQAQNSESFITAYQKRVDGLIKQLQLLSDAYIDQYIEAVSEAQNSIAGLTAISAPASDINNARSSLELLESKLAEAEKEVEGLWESIGLTYFKTTASTTYPPTSSSTDIAIGSSSNSAESSSTKIAIESSAEMISSSSEVTDTPLVIPTIDQGDTYSDSIPEDTNLSIALSTQAMANTTLEWAVINTPGNLTTIISSDDEGAMLALTPSQNFNGPLQFSVVVSSLSASDTILITLEVTPVNDAPTITEKSTILGTPEVGETLTISSTCIDVESTIASLTPTIEWFKSTEGYTNATSIGTNASVELTDLNEGNFIYAIFSCSDEELTVSDTTDLTVKVPITTIQYTVTIPTSTGGTVDTTGAITLTSNTPLSVVATASAGYTFDTWTVTSGAATIANPTSVATTITLATEDATVTATFIENVAPAAPLGITSSGNEDGEITISWAVSPESDIAGYKLYNNGTEVYDGATPTTVISSLSKNKFQVTAYDDSGNESELSKSLYHFEAENYESSHQVYTTNKGSYTYVADSDHVGGSKDSVEWANETLESGSYTFKYRESTWATGTTQVQLFVGGTWRTDHDNTSNSGFEIWTVLEGNNSFTTNGGSKDIHLVLWGENHGIDWFQIIPNY